MIRKIPKSGSWFIPKNDLIIPLWCEQTKITSKSHHIFLVHTNKTLDHTMTLYNHTMCVWFTPSQNYSHLKMVLFIPTRFVFTPCKFCSHRQDFIHIMKFLYSQTPISDHTLQTWFTPFLFAHPPHSTDLQILYECACSTRSILRTSHGKNHVHGIAQCLIA
jgi:hypothetical protein